MTAPAAPKRLVTRAAELLDDVYGFLGRFVAYPSEAAQLLTPCGLRTPISWTPGNPHRASRSCHQNQAQGKAGRLK
jgi:hypothetical protein